MKKNKSLCTINHKRFQQLFSLTSNYQKAVFLDKCIFWWQISTYTLGCNKIFFTRSYEQIAKDTNISESSVNRYLKEFEALGYVEKITKLSASNKNGFKVIKRTYIHVTNKLLTLLNVNTQFSTNDSNNISIFLDQPDIIENVTMTESLYKDKDLKTNNNNIVKPDFVNYGDNNQSKTKSTPLITYFPIERDLGERITTELKNQVKGMLYNLEIKQGIKLFDKNRLFAEIIFTLTNEEQLKGVNCMKHKINIVSVILQKRQWKTPKGFLNHWDIGTLFKERDDVRARRLLSEKLERELEGIDCLKTREQIKARFMLENLPNISPASTPLHFQNHPVRNNKQFESTYQIKCLKDKLKAVSHSIFQEGQYLQQVKLESRGGGAQLSLEAIEALERGLQKLYAEQRQLEMQLLSLNVPFTDCA